MKLAAIVLSLCLSGFGLMAQTTTPPACTDNVPYNYFGSTGANYEAGVLNVTTGFGVKAGTCSNVFLDTIISTGVGQNANPVGVSSLTEHFEYHIAHTHNWSFLADGQIGVAQISSSNSTATGAMFGGGFGTCYDAGFALSHKVDSKGNVTSAGFHLPVCAHADYTTVQGMSLPNGGVPVKPNYTFEFRKTF